MACELKFVHCPELTQDLPDVEVGNALRRLRSELDKEIMPCNKFIMFESEFTKEKKKFTRIIELIESLDESDKKEIPEFDIIGFDQECTNASLETAGVVENTTFVYLPIYGDFRFRFSFQHCAFRIDLLRRVIDAMLETETVPFITATQIIPMAYAISIGYFKYMLLGLENEAPKNGVKFNEMIESDIKNIHSPLIGVFTDLMVKEFAECSLL